MCAISSAGRRDGARRLCGRLGVDEIYPGKGQKFLTVVGNLQSGEPVWFGWERKQETLDRFFQQELSSRQRHGIEAACVDMHEPFRLSLEAWAPQCHLIYDKFHIMQPANEAVTRGATSRVFSPRQGDAGISERQTLAATDWGRGYRDINYLLLKAQRLAFTKTEFIAFEKAA